jgi:hypothetical protein
MDPTILSGISSKGSTFERQFVKVDIIQELIEFLGYQDIAKKICKKTCKFTRYQGKC